MAHTQCHWRAEQDSNLHSPVVLRVCFSKAPPARISPAVLPGDTLPVRVVSFRRTQAFRLHSAGVGCRIVPRPRGYGAGFPAPSLLRPVRLPGRYPIVWASKLKEGNQLHAHGMPRIMPRGSEAVNRTYTGQGRLY